MNFISHPQLLVPLVSAYRYEGDEVNMSLAKSEAKIFNQKINDKAYNDDELIRILTTRSKAQLNATFNQYNDHFGKAITKVLYYTISPYLTSFKPYIQTPLGPIQGLSDC